jgi:cytoskeletal protein CcmA (bactofilin family)
MFKSDGKQSDLNGFLDKGSHLQGELRFDTSFRVHGSFKGTVTSDGELMVGEGGEVEGELKVGEVFVSGVLRGAVRASRKVHIAPTGKVFADLDTPSLVIDSGAFFEGRCSMSRDGAKPATVAKLVAPKALAKAEG